MKKKLSITVRGKEKTWSFNFDGNTKYLKEWREDGLEIDEIINIIPEWIAKCGLTRPWLFLQDLINLNFFKG